MKPDRSEVEATVARLVAATGTERTHLLEVLLGIQKAYHHVPKEAAEEIRRRMGVPVADTYGIVTFYDLLTVEPTGEQVVRICDDVTCHLLGSTDLLARAGRDIGPEGAPGAAGGPSWVRSPCLGLCDRAPAAIRDGVALAPLRPADLKGGARRA